MALPNGFTLDQILALPEVADAIEKARNGAHEVCGLWLNTDRGYMSGASGKLKYWVFKNDRKPEGSKQPDYRLCVSRQLPREDHPQASTRLPRPPEAGGDSRQQQPQAQPQRQAPPRQRQPSPYGFDERGESTQNDYSAF